MDTPSPERLDENARALLTAACHHLGPQGQILMQQARRARVVASSPTMIDVDVPTTEPLLDLPDGPIAGRLLVVTADELSGEILIWVRSGRLIGLEQAWYTDSAPAGWPQPSQLEWTHQNRPTSGDDAR
ncbi:hypothetical protein [Microbacterium gorillae]|uniref:hypothetical protein n=1 Tax=Microbacterium gorillae TaxID=1231063 RepID=UPI003D97AE2F